MKEKFLENVSNWNNHLPLLWKALEETESGVVLEYGCGDGSTRQLSQYCNANKRHLTSYDSNNEWLDRFKDLSGCYHFITNRLDIIYNNEASVVLIDHAPGEERHIIARSYKDFKGILVLHDTEPVPCGGNYMWDKVWPDFKYRVDIKVPMNGNTNGTWASAVSNEYDLTKWIGEKFGNYEIS